MADKQDSEQDAPESTETAGAACKNPPKETTQQTTEAAKPAPDKPEADANPAPDKPDADPKLKDAELEKKTENLPDTVDKDEDDEPEPRVYTPEEIEEIAAKVETYKDATPKYDPQHILSPEFEGTSNYERGITEFRAEKQAELERLSADSDTTPEELSAAKNNVRVLDHLYENYHLGMNVFRTAKGGRSKLRV